MIFGSGLVAAVSVPFAVTPSTLSGGACTGFGRFHPAISEGQVSLPDPPEGVMSDANLTPSPAADPGVPMPPTGNSRLGAEALGTFWLVLGGCGTAIYGGDR